MTPSIEMVVARYREDVSWIDATGLPAVVYDKSGQPAENPLPNIGRESHTYLHHIVSRYPQFPEHTVFVQAAPFGHMAPGTTPESFGEQARELAARGVPFKGFAFYKLRCDVLGRPHELKDEKNRSRWAGFGKDIPMGEIYAQLFAGPVPESFHVRAPAGLFMVSRRRILLRPFAMYRKALKIVESDPHDANNTGHAFERLWCLIFGGNARLNMEWRHK